LSAPKNLHLRLPCQRLIWKQGKAVFASTQSAVFGENGGLVSNPTWAFYSAGFGSAKESGAQFGDEFLASIAFIAKAFSAEIALDAGRASSSF
jgi:hypothetical protein